MKVGSFLRAEWVFYELHRIGRTGLAMPLLTAAGFASMAALMVAAGAEEGQIARLLTAGLELGLPLAAGVVAAAVVDDPAIDLHLTFVTRFSTTVLRRLSLIVGWTALVALLWAILLRLVGLWVVPRTFPLDQLAWFAPLVWFVAAGALLAVIFRSRTVSGSVLAGLWLFENIFYPFIVAHEPLRPFFLFATTYVPDANYWLLNRLVLVASGVMLGIVLAWVVRNSESSALGGDV